MKVKTYYMFIVLVVSSQLFSMQMTDENKKESIIQEFSKAVVTTQYEKVKSLLENPETSLLISINAFLQEHPAHQEPYSIKKTPLMHAAFYGNAKLVELLIQNNADVKIKDSKGRQAVWYCLNGEFDHNDLDEYNQRNSIYKLLISRGGSVLTLSGLKNLKNPQIKNLTPILQDSHSAKS